MNTHRTRGEQFVRLVGLELKGAIVKYGWTAQDVAREIGRPKETFNRWLNGTGSESGIPMSVVCAACEVIGIAPKAVVDGAYVRLIAELGKPTRATSDDSTAAAHAAGSIRQSALQHIKGRKRTTGSHN